MAAEDPPKVYCVDSGNQFPFHVSCFRIADELVEEATYRVFKIGDISILVDLKDLCRRIGLEWNFVSRRSGNTIACNRASRSSSFVNSGIRKSSSILCGCGWLCSARIKLEGVRLPAESYLNHGCRGSICVHNNTDSHTNRVSRETC